MSASRRRPTSRFQPGIAAMYACTGASPSAFAMRGLPPESRATAAFAPTFFGPFWATAAFTSALNAPASTSSPSWMSIALRVLPSKLELKRREGSGTLAPRANVSFATFVYASPVQTIPRCDQTGFIHFHSSVISGSACRISARMRARVSPRHPPRSRIRWSMSREAGFGGDLAFVPAFAVFVALAAGLRAAPARDARFAFGFAFGFALAPTSTRFILPLSANAYAMQLCTAGTCASQAATWSGTMLFVVRAAYSDGGTHDRNDSTLCEVPP